MTKKKYYGGLSVDLETVSLIQTFSLDGRFFVYIPDNEHGGRIIASDEIISLVPSYNCKGSMLCHRYLFVSTGLIAMDMFLISNQWHRADCIDISEQCERRAEQRERPDLGCFKE